MSDLDLYSDDRCEAAAAWAVELIEREVRGAFVVREYVETHNGGCREIVLDQSYAVNDPAIEAEVDGNPVTDTLRVDSGVLRRFTSGTFVAPLLWAAGFDNVE